MAEPDTSKLVLGSRQRFFQDIGALTCCLCFDNFEALLAFMARRLEPNDQDTS